MEIRRHISAKRGSYRQYTHENLTDAYNAIIDQKLPVERAAKQYGVPITTLKDRVKLRVNIDVVKSGPDPIFSLDQETLLSNHVDTMAELGYGYSRLETLNLASDYAVYLGIRTQDKPLSLQWLYSFLQRWPELKVIKPRSLEIARAKSATQNAINNYFQELDKILTSNNLKGRPQAIYNIDEKGLSLSHKPPKILSGSRYKAQVVTHGKSPTVTVIGGANALRNQVPPFFVFPGKRTLGQLLEGASSGASGTVSETGWSNTTIFNYYMQSHLSKFLPERSADNPVIVLYDGHKSHVSLGLIEWARNQHIILFVLPPHCSHLLQPLDVSCFGPFETAWNAALHSRLRFIGGQTISRFEVCSMVCQVYASTLTPKNIHSAFRKVGIFPFDASVISRESVAPSLSFSRQPTDVPHGNANTSVGSNKTDHQNNPSATSSSTVPSANLFLESKGAVILQNLKTSKPRNTLSKVVGGKAITEDTVYARIEEHIQSQAQTSRKRPSTDNSPTKPSKQMVSSAGKNKDSPSENSMKKGKSKSNSSKGKGKAVKKSATVDHLSDSDSDASEDEKCIICKRFYPADRNDYVKIVNWGQCGKCNGWVHLRFCSPINTIRRGDNFYCPKCTDI